MAFARMELSPPGTAVCAMCGGARAASSTSLPFLCASPYCAARHAALPPFHTCVMCRAPLSVERRAQGICAQASCRDARLLQQARDGMRELKAAMYRAAVKRRDRAAAKRGASASEYDTYLIAVIPRNDDKPSPLPQTRRDTFEARFRQSLREARDRRALGDTPFPPTIRRPLQNGRTEAEQRAEVTLVNSACGICRGNCCKSGGDHAFITSDTLMTYLDANPTHDDETIVARYLSLMPSDSLPLGCVYQHATGCALPREMRSDVCNRFYCEYVSVLWNKLGPGDPVRAFVLHHESHQLEGGRILEIPVQASDPD